jgi:very-short-patch-repair endonuclease
MKAWQKNMSKITQSGTGKQDFFHRREAQKNLNNCREAIPAWIMPLHRIWDTVSPEPGIFDVIIIDEASQCGFEALPLFFMAKKILIVGDDKQISPEAEGVRLDAVTQLINEFLYDFDHKASFNINRSLFGQGELRYSANHIVLREHFRCMPEIIRFSNDLCYSDTPLIALRQYGPDRLAPLEHVFVDGGYREGKNSHAINRPEADAIVEKIVELCEDKRYFGKTMGVIILQGNAQAGLIEKQLLERLGAEEMEKRRLICGNSYSFQGDERDIIFLSMVAASNMRIQGLGKPADVRRFNVAVSRARDQMILFHSVATHELSDSCLRRRLLEYFENPVASPIGDGIDWADLEYRAIHDNRSRIKPPHPFHQPAVVKGSWFEVDVALEIHRKGYRVIPQFPIAGRYIDLIVEGGIERLAIECDGDYWHGANQYEEDMQRQRQLERCDWEFFRVRESVFRANKDVALMGLWRMLEERGIRPGGGATAHKNEKQSEESGDDVNPSETDENSNEQDSQGSAPDDGAPNTRSRRHPEEVSSQQISDAIIHALRNCQNHSCTLHSLTGRVLKEVGVLTRGKPRARFERRVNRMVNSLCEKDRIEKYKAKNERVRLLRKMA